MALAWLYKEYRASVYGPSLRLLKNKADAEDVTADVFVKIMQVTDRKEALKDIRDLLNRAMVNLVADKKKKQQIEKTVNAQISSDQAVFSDDEMKKAEIHGVIWYYIYFFKNKLPPRSLQIFELHYLEQKSIREIALVMNLSEKSVSNLKSSALRVMRLEISPLRPIIFSITFIL